MILALHLIAFALYATAWILQLRGFHQGREPGRNELLAVRTGAAVHAAGLIAFTAVHRVLPLVGVGPASSSLALAIAVFVAVASVRTELRPSGLLMLPLVLLLMGEAIFVGIAPASAQITFRGPWFVLHVSTIFVGYAGLAAASAAAIMYLLQFRALKQKEFGSVFRFFPALDSLDQLNKVGLAVGFPALTVGLLAGWSWTLTFGRGLDLENPGAVLGIVTWMAYLAAIVVRLRPGPRSEKAAAVSALAFLVTFAAFIALRLTARGTGFFL
jgi:ABC-type uncharacterized transport system permease subunit